MRRENELESGHPPSSVDRQSRGLAREYWAWLGFWAELVVLALVGLFIAAAWENGSLHVAGVALFATSGIIVFLSLKNVFDNLDRRR